MERKVPPEPNSDTSLIANQVQSSAEAKNKVSQLEKELVESTNMVLLAMTTSSDLGWVIEFLKKAFRASSLDNLAHGLLEHLQAIGLNGSVWFTTSDKPHCINMIDDDDQIDMLFIQRHRDDGRIVTIDNALLINFEHVSLLIDNMPEDPDRCGRLRDSVATLLEGVESRVNGLVAEEKATAARKARDEFYSIMSHELRTPLNPIIGFSNVLTKKLKGRISEKEFRNLTSIRQNGEHLLTLINNLLDLSSIEHGEMSLHRQTFRIDELIKRAVDLVEVLAEKHGVEIIVVNQSEAAFFADSEKFTQIVLNLLSNAIKFSPEGKVAINFHFDSYESLGPCLQVTVEDNGIGIDKADQPHIFDQFSQTDKSHTRKAEGTGIGLYIANKLVEMHAGVITLESELGSGSKFTIVLPKVE